MLRRLEHFDELSAKARAINHRIMEAQRVGQGNVLASPAFERIAHPSLEDGRRAPALRFGDPRLQALAGALAHTLTAALGITNRSLRAHMPALLGGGNYTTSQASIATRLLPPREGEHRIPTDGVTATVEDDHAEISIVLVTRWGHNCRDIAEQVQDHVAEHVHSYTGLPATVSITITDVDYNG